MKVKIDTLLKPSYLLKRKTSKAIIVFITLSLVMIIGAIFMLFMYKYHPYKIENGYVQKKDDEYLLVLYLSPDDMASFQENKLLLDEEVSYEIVDISRDYYVINNELYYMLSLKVPLQESDKIDNNIVNVIIEKPKTTLWREIKKGWKK